VAGKINDSLTSTWPSVVKERTTPVYKGTLLTNCKNYSPIQLRRDSCIIILFTTSGDHQKFNTTVPGATLIFPYLKHSAMDV